MYAIWDNEAGDWDTRGSPLFLDKKKAETYIEDIEIEYPALKGVFEIRKVKLVEADNGEQ